MNRRDFLQRTLGLMAVQDAVYDFNVHDFSAPGPDGAPAHRPGLPIHQAFADATSTLLTVVRETGRSLAYRAEDSEGRPLPVKVYTHSRNDSKWGVDLLMIDGLALNADHRLFVASEKGEPIDRRVFRALDLKNPDARVCVISCTSDANHRRQSRMWDSLKAVAPDVVFCIGDAVYIEETIGEIIIPEESPPEKIWRRFVETRQALDFFRFERLIPMMAIWDDHDFGHNGSGESFRYKFDSKLCFETFFPRPRNSERFEPGPGLAFRWDAFGTRFIFLDGRFFRRNASLGASGTHWGVMQKGWLQTQMAASPHPIWLLNGCQFLGDWIFNDSVIRNHPEDLKWLFERMRGSGPPVTLFSGDVHYSEIVQLPPADVGGAFYEITSSSMHTVPGAPFLNNRTKRLAVTRDNNFVVVHTVEATGGRAVMDVVSYGDNQRELFNVRLTAERAPAEASGSSRL